VRPVDAPSPDGAVSPWHRARRSWTLLNLLTDAVQPAQAVHSANQARRCA
jgi:hypothetical protein